MSRSDFDAFTLPRAVGNGPTAPEVELLSFDEPGIRVRYPDTTPEWIGSVADALLTARDGLVGRRAVDIAHVLGRVGARFLDASDPLRREALSLLPGTSALSPEMSEAVLDGMASDWTAERLVALLRAELGSEQALDGFVAHPADRRTMAIGPALCVQIVAGSVPGVGVSALLRSLLLKGPTLLKPGRGDVVLPVLFARALRAADPELADALAVVYWPGGAGAPEDAALARADVVTAYGSDATVEDLRARTSVATRFVGYHHRVSVGIVGRDALADTRTMSDTAAEVAESVAFFDRRGCVSPQVIFVEDSADGFARVLAEQLDRLESRLPSGEPGAEGASALHQLRGTAELMAATGSVTLIHGGEAPWTVVLERSEASPGSCSGRTITVRPVGDASAVPDLLAPLRGHLQTVGVAGLGDRLEETAAALARAGASRVVPFRGVAFPPPWWHHDGRGPLLDLLRWVDLEEEPGS